MTDSPTTKEQPRGDVRAYDVRTGKLRWQFHVIPQAGEFGVETWEDDSWKYSGQAPVWSLFSADEELGYVYMPVTAPTSDMYGGHRLGDNLFGQSLVCVSADTGERMWHFQLTHHDLWDYDPPAAPILADITVDGRPIKAVVQLTKQAFAYVFDRVTGTPVWPIEERPVPQSIDAWRATPPTQPFPTKPPPFDRQGSTMDNLIDFTPELRAEAIEITKQYVTGPLFTPPSIRGDRPGRHERERFSCRLGRRRRLARGAFDPETGLALRAVDHHAFRRRHHPGRSEADQPAIHAGTRASGSPGPRGLPLFKPPYGRITAIDLNTRRAPLDGGERRRPAESPGAPAPQVAAARKSGPCGAGRDQDAAVHRRGLARMATVRRAVRPGCRPRSRPATAANGFKALDKATGATLWRMRCPPAPPVRR